MDVPSRPQSQQNSVELVALDHLPRKGERLGATDAEADGPPRVRDPLTDCVLTPQPSASPAHAVASRSVSGDLSRSPMRFVSRAARSSSRDRWALLPVG